MRQNFFFDLAYDIVLTAAGACYLFVQRIFQKKYMESFGQRFGEKFPQINKKGRKLFWLHAVSVGETKALAPFAKKLQSSYPEAIILVSSITETGHAEALRSIPFAKYHVYLPLDASWIIAPLVAKAAPDLVVISETDLWYSFLNAAKKAGAFVAVVNGKLSKRSEKRLKTFAFFTRRLYSLVDIFCLQSDLHKSRMHEIGISEKKLAVTGNTKLDLSPAFLSIEEKGALRRRLAIEEEEFVIVAGSTHPGEEALIVEAMKSVWEVFPKTKLLLAPRHPERFEQVAAELTNSSQTFSKWSQLAEKPPGLPHAIILIDCMGKLEQLYQLATIALVGGSFLEGVGGHNILEPCWYGVPTLFGPYMHSQPDLVGSALSAEAALQLPSEELPATLVSLLTSGERRARLSSNGKQLTAELAGSSQRCLEAIQNLLIF